jgi:triosephosphate isomerase (TIM)
VAPSGANDQSGEAIVRGSGPLIVGNWKMNGLRDSLREIDIIAGEARRHEGVSVVICPPATLIEGASAVAKGVGIGAQNCHVAMSGAFTGQISAQMLLDAGAGFVILGHSECRALQSSESDSISAKAEHALATGLSVIVCVGEAAQARDGLQQGRVVAAQLRRSLPSRFNDNLIIAYEPIWAIGTGTVPIPSQIEIMHARIREVLIDLFGPDGGRLPILYGGSATAANADELLAVDGVDGLLVGGASLTAETFVPIIRAASRHVAIAAAPMLATQ